MGMQDLKNSLKKINKVLPVGSKIIYFDYPVYSNIGDMLIWKGTEQFFKESKIKVINRFSHHLVNFLIKKQDKLMKIPSSAIIVCQGGGNFGDLYTVHQNLRKLLVKHYPNNKIVFLPQSIHYENKDGMHEELSFLSKHKDLHLYVRDKNSLSIASKYLKNVYLCPDMAHELYGIKSKSKNKSGTLYFIRADIERTDYHLKNSQLNITDEFDWDLLYTKTDIKIMNLLTRFHTSYKLLKILPPNLLSKIWYTYTNYMINKAINLFYSYETIITSRLHGHILACLLNIENKVIDNSYGKNSSYFNCWTNSLDISYLYDENRHESKEENIC